MKWEDFLELSFCVGFNCALWLSVLILIKVLVLGWLKMITYERIIVDKSNSKRLLEIKMESNDGEFIDNLEKVIQDYIDDYDNSIYVPSKRPYRLVG